MYFQETITTDNISPKLVLKMDDTYYLQCSWSNWKRMAEARKRYSESWCKKKNSASDELFLPLISLLQIINYGIHKQSTEDQ